MIIVTRLNGPEFAMNPDLVERVEATPDTVVTLVDGTKYVVAESLPQLIARVREYRASVIAEAAALERHMYNEGSAETWARRRPEPEEEEHEPSPVIPLHLREV